MKAFHFPLERVLAWRRTQLELEEIKFKRETTALAELDRRLAELQAEAVKAESQVRELIPVMGRDLAALASFRAHVKAEEAEIARGRAERLKKVAEQKQAMLGARRRCRLLERLKGRRLEEWRAAESRELEEAASESFLAKWSAADRTARP